MATNITKKPSKTVTSLGAPVRGSGNHVMTATWKVPSTMTSTSSESRATSLLAYWTFYVGGKKKSLKKEYLTSVTTSSLNLDNVTIGGTTYTRNSFYPKTQKLLTSVSIAITAKNSKGYGTTVYQTRKFSIPRKPTIDNFSFSTAGTTAGRCSTIIRTDAGADYQERYDTRYRVTVRNANGSIVTTHDSTSTSTAISVYTDLTGYQSLSGDQYIRVKAQAWSRGYAGASNPVEKNFYVAKPKPATITSATVSSLGSSGRVNVRLKTNATTTQPVDVVKLEYLADVAYATESAIPANAEWEESGVEDNGKCTALTASINGLVPSAGNHTWIRIKSYRLNENVLFSYSKAWKLTALETPAHTAQDDSATILSAVAGENGDSAIVHLGWNADGTDDSTGTELSWATEEDAWRSTKEPNRYEFEWSDGAVTQGGVTYQDSATITIKELDEGEKYYIRARRYADNDEITYGNYSNTAIVVPAERPSAVVPSYSKYIISGDPLSVYWTFSGNGLQRGWSVELPSGTTIDDGEGSFGNTRISWDRIADYIEDDAITFRVLVSTGSESVASEWCTVQIRERPTLSITADNTLTEQPYSFTAESNRPCDLIVIVTAQGASGQFPQGVLMQASGDTIHSDVYSPVWVDGEATIEIPADLDFWDLGSYTLSVVAVDRETELRSETIEQGFTVAWDNQAANPESFVSLMPLDYQTADGDHIQAVQITLTPPTGSNASDVYDIYRMDGNDAHLIGEGFPLTYTVVDEYAPFGDNEDLFYRIALRTVDGDVEFADKPYELPCKNVRFDWAGGTLELPYGLSIGDNYKKSVEFRQHMDGSVDGYWNQNVERGASYNSAIIKLIQPNEINLARQLAKYAGAVFVRTANGSAFVADVQVTDLSVKNEAVTTIAIDANEVGMTDEFMLPSPFELEDE